MRVMKTLGYAALKPGSQLVHFPFERRALRSDDVALEILYCGVCHTDLHLARNDWGFSRYPLVPGHEIVGRVTQLGSAVTKHRVGDVVAIGVNVDSCGTCKHCKTGDETLCIEGSTVTYNGIDRISGDTTFGGYSKHLVVKDTFALKVPTSLDASKVGPLLCAGTTMWTPLKQWNVGKGTRVAVVGLGGLGHIGVKLAAALGAEVTAITRSASKSAEAKKLGATSTLVSTDADAMKTHERAFDLIIDTIPVQHDLKPYVPLLDVDGTLVSVGAITMSAQLDMMPLTVGRRRIAAAGAGGTVPTQEMLDFCAEKNVLPETELIGIHQLDEAFERMERGDVRYRFVIDMATLTQP